MKSKIEQYLKDNQVDYEGTEHPPAATAEEYNQALSCRYEQQAKVLLLSYKKDAEKEYAALAIQGHKKADLEKIKQLIGASKIKLADRQQLKELTGCGFGALHPFAKLFGLKLIMDKDLLAEEKIYITASCTDYSIIVDPTAVQKLEDPRLV